MIYVILFESIDFLAGIIKAVMLKQLKSSVMYKGFCKKMLLFLFYCSALLIDKAMPDVTNGMVGTFAYGYIIIMELISIAENTADAGIIKKMKEFFGK